jgi:hypothetical protein
MKRSTTLRPKPADGMAPLAHHRQPPTGTDPVAVVTTFTGNR